MGDCFGGNQIKEPSKSFKYFYFLQHSNYQAYKVSPAGGDLEGAA
jgi:hypothetical protein